MVFFVKVLAVGKSMKDSSAWISQFYKVTIPVTLASDDLVMEFVIRTPANQSF